MEAGIIAEVREASNVRTDQERKKKSEKKDKMSRMHEQSQLIICTPLYYLRWGNYKPILQQVYNFCVVE